MNTVIYSTGNASHRDKSGNTVSIVQEMHDTGGKAGTQLYIVQEMLVTGRKAGKH